jgi:hypothetical protein
MLGAPGRYIWGYNFETSTFVDPRKTTTHDIMSYCDGDTFSDYNYRRVQVYLTPADKLVKTASAAVAAGPQELLLISGQVEAGKLELMPLKSLQGEARLPQDGPYTLRILTAQGTVEYRFALKQTDHESPSQRFGFTIPNPGTILGITIVKDGATLVQRAGNAARPNKTAQAAASDKPQVQFSEQGGQLRLSWDHAKHPYLTVIHVGAQRTTLAQDLESGSASLPLNGLPAGGAFEFSLSDGLNTARVTLNR